MTHRTAHFGPKNNMEVGASCESERCNLTDATYYLARGLSDGYTPKAAIHED